MNASDQLVAAAQLVAKYESDLRDSVLSLYRNGLCRAILTCLPSAHGQPCLEHTKPAALTLISVVWGTVRKPPPLHSQPSGFEGLAGGSSKSIGGRSGDIVRHFLAIMPLLA